jgi:hypothetical protein
MGCRTHSLRYKVFYKSMITTHSFAILAPVPEMHLLSAMETMAQLESELGDEKPKTAFGSMDFEIFRRVDESRAGKNVKVLIYASHSDTEQPFYSQTLTILLVYNHQFESLNPTKIVSG